MQFRAYSLACFLSTVMLLGCQSNNGTCQSPADIKAQRQMCNQLKKERAMAAERKNWQYHGFVDERYKKECEQMLYYRENHSDNQIKACPNRGMPKPE